MNISLCGVVKEPEMTDQPTVDEHPGVSTVVGTEHSLLENSTVAGSAVNPIPTLSKRQMKKLIRKEKMLENRAERRIQEKKKKKEKHKEAKKLGMLGPSRKRLKTNTMALSSCRIKVAIDCSFDEYMTEKDIVMLVKQLQHCYSANRRADNPLQLSVCGINGKTRERLEMIGDYKNWDVFFKEEGYFSVFNKDSIVYLSSESPNILQDLDSQNIYIIGGLVDHNHHKGLCHRLAEEKGIAHAQLPISEYLDIKTRKVLTINHVFEILVRFTESKDWREAFFSVLPQRKGAKLKAEIIDNGDDADLNAACDNKNSTSTDGGSTSGVTEPHCGDVEGKQNSVMPAISDNTTEEVSDSSARNDDTDISPKL